LLLKVHFASFAPLLLILINLIPLAGLITPVKGFFRLAGNLIARPFAIALVIGIYAHCLRPGTDNVLRLPPEDLRLPFQVSAVLLVLLEALGCWIGLRILVHGPEQRTFDDLKRRRRR
jgi:hypothetical protein